MNIPMMKCGCAAQGVCNSFNGVNYDPPIPSCIVHECIEIADSPDLSGRFAKCFYMDCSSVKPSSLDLPFFEYMGPGSPETQRKCVCGYYQIAHEQRWRATLKVLRRWFAIPHSEQIIVREFHAPEELKSAFVDKEVEFFRQQTVDEKTRVFGVEVLKVIPIKSTLQCRQFTAIGPQKMDKFYCGCKGWE